MLHSPALYHFYIHTIFYIIFLFYFYCYLDAHPKFHLKLLCFLRTQNKAKNMNLFAIQIQLYYKFCSPCVRNILNLNKTWVGTKISD